MSAVDPDGPGGNSIVTYRVEGTSSFTINPGTGIYNYAYSILAQAIIFLQLLVKFVARCIIAECVNL